MVPGNNEHEVTQPINEQSGAPYNNNKYVIGVAGSKGGVGKSFITCLMAVELSRAGFRVGILDANFFGASISSFFGLNGPVGTGQYSFVPIKTSSGIKVISVNLIVEDDTRTIVWKDSLTANVIQQLYKEVEWGELDFLLVDLPPATSELAVAIMQTIPFTGVLVVSQPHDFSRKLSMKVMRAIQEIGIEIIGVVENMSSFTAPDTNDRVCPFGQPNTVYPSPAADMPVLARLPLVSANVDLCNRGQIEKITMPESAELCSSFLEAISRLPVQMSEVQIQEPGITNMDENRDTLDEDLTDSLPEMTHDGQYFSDIVIQLIRNKDNVGSMSAPDAQGHFIGACGDRMQIDLQIVNERILDAKFLADGCGATLACGSMITKMACSKKIKEAENITSDDLISALDGLPDDHLHCAELAVMTLREAIIDAIEGHKSRKA